MIIAGKGAQRDVDDMFQGRPSSLPSKYCYLETENEGTRKSSVGRFLANHQYHKRLCLEGGKKKS